MTRVTLTIGELTRFTRTVVVSDNPPIYIGDVVKVDGDESEWDVAACENCDSVTAALTLVRRSDPRLAEMPADVREQAERIEGKMRAASESVAMRELRGKLDECVAAAGACRCRFWFERGADPFCLRCRMVGIVKGEGK